MENQPQTSASIGMMKTILLLMKLSLAGIVVFGLVRTLAYKSFEWSDAAGDAQITVLIIKHIFMTAIFALGLWQFLKARKWVRKIENEKNE